MNTELLLRVVRETCTAEQVKEFLRNLGLRASAGKWDDLIATCLKPHLASGALKVEQLIELLQEVEEHGNQHVFLYSLPPDKAKALIDKRYVTSSLKSKALEGILAQAKILDKPATATLAAVRWEPPTSPTCLIVKFVQKHEYRDLIGEKQEGSQWVIRYQMLMQRIVDLVKISASGLVEARLARRDSAVKYKDQLSNLWHNIEFLIPKDGMTEISLNDAKDRLLKTSKDLSTLVRYTTSTLRNDFGFTARFAAGGKTDDLVTDGGSKNSVDAFLEQDGHCEDANIWFKAGASGGPDRDIHVHVKGELNEFVIPAQCNRQEYDYVLFQLRNLNKPLS